VGCSLGKGEYCAGGAQVGGVCGASGGAIGHAGKSNFVYLNSLHSGLASLDLRSATFEIYRVIEKQTLYSLRYNYQLVQ
jgi:hypothetical protein